MSYQDQFDLLPEGVQVKLATEFQDVYLRKLFEQTERDCWRDIMDDFLKLPDVKAAWDDYQAMLWRDFLRDGGPDMWDKYLAEVFGRRDAPQDGEAAIQGVEATLEPTWLRWAR